MLFHQTRAIKAFATVKKELQKSFFSNFFSFSFWANSYLGLQEVMVAIVSNSSRKYAQRSGSFSGADETAVYSRTAMCYTQVPEESHRYAP